MKEASSSSSSPRKYVTRSPSPLLGPEALLLAIGVVGNHRRGGVEDVLRRAVVALESHRRRFGKVVLEVEDVAQVGAAPLVDGLVRITHHRDVVPGPTRCLISMYCGRLVSWYSSTITYRNCRWYLARMPSCSNSSTVLSSRSSKSSAFARSSAFTYAVVDLRDLLVAIGAVADLVGRLHAVLGLADAPEDLSRLDDLVVDLQLAHHLLHGAHLIAAVVDHEVARQPDCRSLASQQSRAQRVDRRDPHIPRIVADQLANAFAHLLGGLVGAGHRDHLERPRQPAANQIRDAIRNDARFPRTRSRQDQQRPLGVQHCLTLLRIQRGEEVFPTGPRVLGPRDSTRAQPPAPRVRHRWERTSCLEKSSGSCSNSTRAARPGSQKLPCRQEEPRLYRRTHGRSAAGRCLVCRLPVASRSFRGARSLATRNGSDGENTERRSPNLIPRVSDPDESRTPDDVTTEDDTDEE